ncbi:hypothetical protein HXZ94_01490 [Empedobacter falsenii]|uniref:hypothetical protein n=1 Tax=Empedobacter falsenii TaxID=343874 RepID=UPI002575A5C0|nr:hypothetical protein [Empedobacter falsenii]MDM1297181.1 hypothetical protein [Empedobacter falsenii]MDM1316974.1 hypothetical protein [Empedobacter falsenii]
MKKLITLFAILLGLVNAQEKKPTKEETIEYINNKLSQIIYYKEEEDSSSKTYMTKSYISSEVENCIIKITYSWERNIVFSNSLNNQYGKRKGQIKIPLNKIEKIVKSYGLTFYVYQNAKSISYVFGDEEKSLDKTENLSQISMEMNESDAEELLKAFNHLRKLCGAPEPLSFD